MPDIHAGSVFLYGSYIKTHSTNDTGGSRVSWWAKELLRLSVFLYGDVSLVAKPRVVIPLS